MKLVLLGLFLCSYAQKSKVDAKIVCGENEVFTDCAPTRSDVEYCALSSDTSAFGLFDPQRDCMQGCACAINHKRDRETKECIPTQDCPPFECNTTVLNEEYNSCPTQRTDKCATDFIGVSKILLICRPSCRCPSGFYRNYETDVCEKCADANE